MMIDAYHVETAQAKLDQIVALLNLIQETIDTEINASTNHTPMLELISLNLTTAYDLTYQLRANMEQVIDAAYHKRKTPGN